MSELGTLLELIHDAHSRVTTFEAEYRDWARPRPNLELQVQRSELSGTQVRWRGAGAFPKTEERTRRIWVQAPSSVRVEILHDQQLIGLGVLTGEQWWRWDHEWGGVSGGEVDGPPDRLTPPPPLVTPPLINPASLLGKFYFEVIGFAERCERRAMSARAAPRRSSRASRSLRYEFDFDAQHGTVLRHAALENGEVVTVTEALSVAYGRPVEREIFECRLPEVQLVRPVQSHVNTASRDGARENLTPSIRSHGAPACAGSGELDLSAQEELRRD